MSEEENVEVVRRLFDGWRVGDFTVGLDALDPYVLFRVRPPFPEAGIRVGPEGISEYLLEFLAQWERFEVEATEVRQAGDTVLVKVLQRAKGRASGIEGEASYYMLFTLRAQRIIRMESIVGESEALEAAGLSEQAMSKENVNLIRGVYEAAAARDRTMPLVSLCDPGIELDVSRAGWGDLTGQDLYHGHDGLRTVFKEWYGAWENYEDHLEDLIDAGDKVVALVTSRGRGRASGVPVELKTPAVWTIREGKIIRVAWFQTQAQALEAAGLSD